MVEDIFFSKKELQEIHKQHFWTFGGEGYIYRIPYKKKYIILKSFYNPLKDEFIWPTLTLQNKSHKIAILKNMKIPNQVQILSPVFIHNEFAAYFMTASTYCDFLFNIYNKFEQIEFLKRLRNQLQRFHQLDMFFGDLKGDNILAHPSNYRLGCLCDLDNMQIREFPIDITAEYVDDFLFQYGDVDENLDWYIFNLLTLETIYGFDKESYMAYVETRKFINYYGGKSMVLREMKHITPEYSGKLLIDDPIFYEEIGVPYIKK